MNQRFLSCFLITIVLLSSIFVGMLGCSSDTPAGSTSTQTPASEAIGDLQPGDVVVTSSVAEGHTHQLIVKYYDLASPPASAKYTTSEAGTIAHTHYVTITKPDLQSIADGKTVKVTSSASFEYNHTHTFSIKK